MVSADAGSATAVDANFETADTPSMSTSSNETSTRHADAEAAHPVPTHTTEPANVSARASLRTRSGIKAGAFNRGGGVYG
jgi:hypothetical protein